MKVKNKTLRKFLLMTLALITVLQCMVPLTVSASATDAEATEEEVTIADFTSIVYGNIDEKLATFGEPIAVTEGTGTKAVTTYVPNGKPTLVKDGFELYYQYDTGEIAIKDTRTGQVLTSNPYDVGLTDAASSASTKEDLLSQIILRYKDADRTTPFSTYKQSALYKQIKMKVIKGGIRVEYTIGKEEKRKLVPRMIEKSSFEENILQYITNPRELDKMNAYYTLKDANASDLTERAKKELQVTYPQTKYYAIYVFDPNASARELTQIEGYIKQYTKYTFEMMDEDHALLDYEAKDKAPPLFKMALEYYIDEEGLYVRLPANGIKFDESTYQLSYINVLPYMGAGRRENTGYTFIPDGSGALVRYEDIKDTSFTLTNDIYGPDYSFYKIVGGSHTRDWRLPVFGAVENYEITRTITNTEIIPAYTDADGNEVPEEIKETNTTEIEKRSDGFLAIIEEGDVLAQITNANGGSLHKYNSVSAMFTPRPTDEYNLDFATKGINSLLTVSSRRKYAGNYIIRYIMLSSDEQGDAKNKNGGYKASYVGMADAYRDYLIKRGELTPMEDTGEDIPLFIESLGTVKTSEYFFGMPYIGTTALTSFDDIGLMIDELNSNGVTNLKFRLNGWINGGLRGTAPAKLKIEKEMGGKNGFREIVNYAKQTGADIYPDLDFAMVWYFLPFDGTTQKKDQARYMDQLPARETKYSYLAQDFGGPMTAPNELIAHERMDQMYTRAMKTYGNFDVGAVSVGSLARELHSNHYKKSLTNRSEAEGYVTDLLSKMKDDHGNLLAVEANAYSFKYLDSIINADLDSSRFKNESESIPFYGMVTHGCINIAGEPINMSGDPQYDILKAIENGASPYFILSYENSNRLKEAASWNLNSYYSVDYTTWLSDMLATYHTLNDALKSVRTKQIVDHEFLAANVVKVTYEGGTAFILNYNHDDEVQIDGHTIAPLDFVKIN